MNIIKSKDTIGHLRQRLLSLFLLSYLFAAHTSAQRTFEYKFSLEDFNIMAEMEAVSIETSKEGWAHTDRAATPIHTLRFLIPPGTEKEDFSVEYEKVLIRKEVSIGKAGWCENVEKALGLPEAPMSAITSPVTDRGIMHYREYRYRCLAVSPFVQDPETKDLNFIPRLAITFPEMEKAEGGTAHESLPDEIMDFRSTLANPDDFGDLYPLREANVVNEDPVDYLIITRDSLTDCFQNLMEWKNRKGLHTRVATLEEIYLQYPQSVIEGMTMDNPLRIKMFIEDCMVNHGTRFVLLGGDVSIVPTRYFFAFGENSRLTPADLFYACFRGSYNWIPNCGLNYWLQDPNIDYSPEVYVSRVPARNAEDIMNFTEKVLRYERDVTDIEAAGRMLMTGAYMPYDGIDPQEYNDSIYTGHIQPHWSGPAYYLYDTGSNLPAGSGWQGNGSLESEINRGYNLIHVCADGEDDRWLIDGNLGFRYSTQEAQTQGNTFPSVFVSNAGFTNAFDHTDCLATSLLLNPDGGAAAYFGNSRNKIESSTEFDFSFRYNAGFFENLFRGHPYDAPYSFGGVAAQVKRVMADDCQMGNNYTSLQCSMNAMGDPEMRIFTDTPHSFLIPFHSSVIIPAVSFSSSGTINVTSTVDSCRIVAVNSDGTIQVAENVSSASFAGMSGVCKVTILRHNYIPFLQTVNLNSSPFHQPALLGLHVGRTSNRTLSVTLYRTCQDADGISDEESGGAIANTEWRLKIVNTQTGEVKRVENVKSATYTVSTAGWESGIYAVHGMDDTGSATEKVVICH